MTAKDICLWCLGALLGLCCVAVLGYRFDPGHRADPFTGLLAILLVGIFGFGAVWLGGLLP